MTSKKGRRSMRKNSSVSRSSGFLGRFIQSGRQKITIMLIPHSEKKVFNFQISLFALSFVSILLVSLVVTFIWLTADFSGTNNLLVSRSNDLEHSEASLEVLRNEVNDLVNSTESFQTTLAKTMGSLGLEATERDGMGANGGDLTSFFNVEQSESNSLSETIELQKLRTSLDNSITTLNEIGQILNSQKELLADIPSLWPLKGVKGYVTTVFGPSIHPFVGQWYLHKGIDLAYGYGVPIMVTANGKVTETGNDEKGFGLYVVVRHKYGFYTKYAHFQRIYVSAGQELSQGDVIGTMGSTGMSTGPHLHYEIRIGSQVVDPAKYLNMTEQNETFTRVSRDLQKYK